MITWSEKNEHGEIIGSGYMLAEGWKLPNVRVWKVYVTGAESIDANGEPFITYRGSRDSLEEAKAFAQADYDSRYAL